MLVDINTTGRDKEDTEEEETETAECGNKGVGKKKEW